ncbi:MAG: methyltransferase domain-containing protein [Thermodesulfobacteriota bacterium]|jgi:SAM-dependent methyltransferase
MVKSDQKRWNEKFKEKRFALGKRANAFLRRNIGLLPKGKALDIATGEGKNAVFLAQRGFRVDAVDTSEVGLKKAENLAREFGVEIHRVLADLDNYQIPKDCYDLIANFYFLDRSLIPKIKMGLKRGGMVIFETYLLDQKALSTEGPKNPRYFLKPNELLRLFKGFRILLYREGIFEEGGRRKAIASLIAKKK